MQRFLVTTADERTWPKNCPILFLGEWCRLYNRKATWQNLDAEMVPYHWDDRDKLHRDYLYLQALYEELLQELSVRLNSLHGVEHSLRYWRILVGPWLGYFVQMLFDRWAMLEQAVKDYSIAGAQILDVAPESLIPNDMRHFEELFAGDEWNEAIYGQLLQNLTAVPVTKVRTSVVQTLTPPTLTLTRRLKRKMAHAASIVSRWFVREDEAFFIATYLPLKQDWKLQWRLGQIPKLWRAFPPPKADVAWEKRQWEMCQTVADSFAGVAREMIPKHIPVLYIEGYSALQSLCCDVPWPKKPSFIFTSNSYSSDDVFKAWAAEMVDVEVPLVVGQHGGNYGVARWSFTEYHQLAISDYWLSWGWMDGKNSRIKPVGNLKIAGCDLDWNERGGALMVEMAMPRYSYHMYSAPVASQWLSYFEDQCRFVAALPKTLRDQVLVRLYSHDYGWCQKQRWQNRFPQIRLDDGAISIAGLIEKSRLYISTYNATTFLESLAMNIPTIIFWKPNHWEMRDSAIPYFAELKKVGIFHESPESAAYQMVRVWDDVAGWWNQPEVQDARLYFCDRFTRMPENPIQILKEALTERTPQTQAG
jgi:putative transferase (TIGR04331 family)